MLSFIDNKTYKTVNIEITTFKKNNPSRNQRTMTDCVKRRNTNDQTSYNQTSRFICSVCLNTKCPREDKDDIASRRKTKSCPVCERQIEACIEKNASGKEIKTTEVLSSPNCKKVQTSQTNINEGLNLLNEVLTVFQNKKVDDKKKLKDAAVVTENRKVSNANLGFSKVFSFSIKNEDRFRDDSKFSVINSHQPYVITKSNINLSKHKSSSIPQMKMEELKKSLKDKTKSKDAVEEVNRMFATVRKNYNEMNSSNTNRPLVRSGPRVLPVVKTNMSNSHLKVEKSEENIPQTKKFENFKRCQTTNYYLSGGDSAQCCCIVNDKEKDDDVCVYRHECDHLQKQRRPDIFVCKFCGNKTMASDSTTTSFK